MSLAELWYRITTRFRRDALARELDEEMRFHQDMLARDLQHAGASAGDAAHRARRQFGNALSLREHSADAWGFPAIESIAQDIRYGLRMLGRSPLFSIVAIGAVGLAIGINSGGFTVVDTLLWRPLPVARPERLVKLLVVDGRGWENIRFSYTNLTTIASHSKTLDEVFGYDARPLAARTGATANATSIAAACVTGNYFAVLGGQAALGRVLAPYDDRDDAAPVVVISDQFWERAFARAPDVVGRDLVVNGAHVTVAGVARREFIGINPLVPDVWMPFAVAARIGATPGRLLDPANRFIVLHARVREGVTIPQARAEISGLVVDPPAAPGTRAEQTRIVGVELMRNESALPLTPETALLVVPGLVLVALILVIACANIANLLLARALARQREIAVRLSLGASRGRLLRQLLTESLVIALLGAALGLVLASWTVGLISRSMFSALPVTLGTVVFNITVSWRVLAYTALLAGVSVLTFGLAPALQATSPNLTSALKGEDAAFGTRMRRSRFRDGLVAVQVAACIVLLVAAGTLVKSLRAFDRADTGLDVRHVTASYLGLAATGHAPAALVDARARFAARVALLPGVVATARVSAPPFGPWPLLHVASAADAGPLRGLPHSRVTSRYFDVVGQRVVSGRAFTAEDSSAQSRVVVVTEAAARVLWPNVPAVGQSLRVDEGSDSPNTVYRVVGVVSDAQSGVVYDWDGAGYVYLPATAADFAALDMPVVVRTNGSVPDFARRVAEVARAVDPDAPSHTDALTVVRGFYLTPLKYAAGIALVIGALGVALAVVGLYGVVAFAVTQRRREIAVHVAMGAAPRDVLRLVLRREMRLVAAGLGVGVVLAAGEGLLLGSIIVPLTPVGAPGVLGFALFILLVAAIATVIPGLGALRIAPIQVLRQD